MEGWVDLGHLLHTEMVYPPAGGHPSKYWPGPVSINYVDRSQRANHYTTLPLKLGRYAPLDRNFRGAGGG